MVETITLSNASQVIVEEIPHLRSTALGVFIKVGSRYESEELAGASHFVEHMLFKGTQRLSARDIAEQFENLGGQVNAYTAREYTCVYGRTLDDDLETAMDIIFDMIFASQFPADEFATEKEVIFEEIRMYEDTPDDLIHDVFNEKFFTGSSMEHPILGTLDSIAALDRDTLYAYYKRYYVPANMILAVAGNVKTDAVIKKIADRMPSDSAVLAQAQFSLPVYQAFINTVAKEVEQVQICVGTPGMSYLNEKRHALTLMNSILGGGMSSRLFQSLREERGLAYSVYSYTSSYSDVGSMAFYIGTGTGKIQQFFSSFFQELERFTASGVQEAELVRSKQMTKASLYMGLESVVSRMTRMGRALMMYGEYQTPEYVIDKITAVSKADVDTLAQELLEIRRMSLAAIASEGVLPDVVAEFNRWFR
jgi:predicted Zn-dependent peptidase